MALLDLFRDRCPACGRSRLTLAKPGALVRVNPPRPMARIPREPALTAYLSCLDCGRRWLRGLYGPIEPCSDEEWLAEVGPVALPPATIPRR